YGTLGQCIHQGLKSEFKVEYYDSKLNDDSKLDDLLVSLKKYDLIIGCTGFTSLVNEHHIYCKNPVIFASISSSDREFDAVHLRKKHKKIQNCHNDLIIGNITLLNSGFPINFDHDYDVIDTDEFQLTRALLFASIYQASKEQTSRNGFV